MKKTIGFSLFVILMIYLIKGGITYTYALSALTIWFEKLVPSMFVSMVLVRVLYQMEILPLLSKALDTGEKKPAPPMKKMKRPFIKKEAPSYMRHVCNGCGYEYDQMLGDPENDIAPGTPFEKLPEEWICPECGEAKDQFIETLD